MLKEEGNKYFKAGSYPEAVEKYKKAKTNLETVTLPDMQALKRTCALNLANCFLNMQQYMACIRECTEVLQGKTSCATCARICFVRSGYVAWQLRKGSDFVSSKW